MIFQKFPLESVALTPLTSRPGTVIVACVIAVACDVFLIAYLYEFPNVIFELPPMVGTVLVATAGGAPYAPAFAKPAEAATVVTGSVNALGADHASPSAPCAHIVKV